MNPRETAVLVAFTLILASCEDDAASTAASQNTGTDTVLPSTNVLDLTHTFGEDTIYWPTEEGFARRVTAEGTTEAGYFYAAGTFTSAEHGGTHIDAPFHFAEGAQTVDEIPLDRLMGSAIVIDVSDHATANPDYRISSEDLVDWEAENGPIPDGSILLFRTGFGQFWPDRARYLGTDSTGAAAVSDLHFPGLSPEAAEWLIENRSVRAVGIDTPSIDYGQSQLFQTHQLLFEENIPAFENVANLDQMPISGAVVVALPMKIERGSGAPLRIIAFVP